MGNSQCTENCSLQDFNIEILKQTKNARTNFTEQVDDKGTIRRTFPAGTNVNQLYTIEFKDETLSRDGFEGHAKVKLMINKDGEVKEQNYGLYFEEDENDKATGYLLGDELKISKSNVPQSDLSFSENDFEFKLTRKLAPKSNARLMWISAIILLLIVWFLLFHKIRKLKNFSERFPLIYSFSGFALILWPLLIFVSFAARGTKDKNILKYYDENLYPDTVEKILLAVPVFPLILGFGLEYYFRGKYSRVKPM